MLSKTNIRDILGFNDTWFLIVGIPLISFVIPLVFFGETLANGLAIYLSKWGISLMYTCAYWFSTRFIYIYMHKRYFDYRATRKRIVYTILAVLITFFVLNYSLDFVHGSMGYIGHNGRLERSDYTAASLTILALVTTIYESAFFYMRWKHSIIEKEQLIRQNIQSQLEGLKSQVNPHFLFNSLNTLIYIIPEDPGRAVKFVQKLSKVYRYILEIRDKKLITLEEELQFLHSYIFLLKERFAGNLQVDLNIPDEILQHKTVPLSLQILFENAIKHNIISAKKPLQIEVFSEGGKRLIVRNSLQKKKQAMPSTKVGLQNIKNRYAFFSERKVEVLENEAHFIVSLPLL